MALKIIKSTDLINVEHVKILLYGPAGTGKTSIAFSAEKPICLAFDPGVYRSEFRSGDTADIGDWSDVAKLSKNDFIGYKTVIVDTVGYCLDYLSVAITKANPKMQKADGCLTLQGYGALKQAFKKWLSSLKLMGLDIILVSHDKKEKDGENWMFKPDIEGGSYNEIMKLMDYIGYIYLSNDERILNFNPTERTEGKNPTRENIIHIPNYLNAKNDTLAKMIPLMKRKLGRIANSQIDSEDIVKGFKSKIDNLLDVQDYNTLLVEASDLLNAGKKSEYEQVGYLMKTKAAENGLVYDKEKREYVQEVIPEIQQTEEPEPVPSFETIVSNEPVPNSEPSEPIQRLTYEPITDAQTTTQREPTYNNTSTANQVRQPAMQNLGF